MKTIKIIVFVIIGIVALVLVIALFVKKGYAVERVVTINKPKMEVFDYVKFLKNQDNYSVWATKDPNMKREYKGTDGTVGFISAWDSEEKNVGKGEQEIKKITEGERIDFELRFIKPFQATEQAYMTIESISDTQTKVAWGFSGKMKYPMNIMLLTMDMEGMIGKDFDSGLNKLKMILEK